MHWENKDAFMRWLYNEFYQPLLSAGDRFVRMSYPNREDIIHDAVVSTFRTADNLYERDDLPNHPNIKGWVFKTFYNKLRDELKKSTRYYKRTKLHPSEKLNRMKQVDVFDQWIENENHRQMLEQIKEIRKTPLDEIVFHDYFIEKMSTTEIAENHGLTDSAVKGIVYRMRKRAKKFKPDIFTLMLFCLWMQIQLFI